MSSKSKPKTNSKPKSKSKTLSKSVSKTKTMSKTTSKSKTLSKSVSKSKTLSKSVSKTKTLSKTTSKTKTLSKTKVITTSKPVLLSHQLKPIKFLVSSCKDQHGIIINHMLGGGKTNIGIFFSKNYPNKKLVIVLPKGLENVWVNACNNIGKKIDEFITFESLHTLDKKSIKSLSKKLKDSIVVIDESHNLINIIKNLVSSRNIFEDEYEEEKKKFDAEKRKIIEDKEKISEDNKSMLLLFLEAFKSSHKVLLLTGTPITNDIADIRWLVNIAAGKKVLPYTEKDFRKNYFKPKIINNILDGWLQNIVFMNVFGIPIIPNNFRIDFTNITYYQDRIIKYIPIILATLKLSKVSLEGISVIGSLATPAFYWKILPYAIAYSIAAKGIYLTTTSLQTIYGMHMYDTLDNKKMNIASPYISFYSTETSYDFPSKKIINCPVDYTNYQLELWTRVVNNLNITNEESVKLGLNKDLTDAELFQPDFINESVYLRKGRIIGNLSSKYEDPIKFKKILKIYNDKPVSTVVYSNFYSQGIELFSNFLKKNSIKHVVFSGDLSIIERIRILEDFKNKKIMMLLIDPIFFEGLSISGARVFHVLEPMDEYHKREQLYARVIRFRSHSQLPKNERNVVIYQWYCTLRDILSKLRQGLADINDWYKHNTDIFYFSRYANFQTFLGPDDTLFNKVMYLHNKLTTFSKSMKSLSIENSKDLEQICCVYGDTKCKNLKQCSDLNL